ncbi:MAG: penicillin-binding protein 2 [Pseudanabaenaceae cyanobacterium]
MAIAPSVKKALRFSLLEQERTVGRDGRGLVLFLLTVVLLLGVLGGRVWYLQFVEGDRNRLLADNNRIRLIPEAPERGRILERRGRILASSRLVRGVSLWPIAQPPQKWAATIAKLSQIINVPASDIQQKLEREGYNSPNLVRIISGISPKLVTVLSERSNELPGVVVEHQAVRYYPNGDLAAHVLGYTGEITAEELEARASKGYRLGDIVGKAGAESAFESILRGEWGGKQVEVDANGRVLRVLGQKLPKAGNTVRLTIDIDLQKAAAQALGDRKGAVVALDPRNGEILAMVSYPTFDPNLFTRPISAKAWQELQEKEFPFVNRALQGFPPASTFKMVPLIAGLETGKFSPDSILQTYAFLDLGYAFQEHNRAGFGAIGFVEAMAYSSNTFFGQVGMRVGGKDLATWAMKLGFGQPTGIELQNEESPGNVPTPEWKRKVLGEEWHDGNSVHMSIGQGEVLATPLQIALMTAIAANGGYKVVPHLNLDSQPQPQNLGLKPSTVATLRRSLKAVFEFGTGAGLGVEGLTIAGKSGTGEDPPRPSHAWFTCFAPYENPEIVVTAFVENAGGGGSAIAGPVAMAVLRAYKELSGR